LPFPQTDPALLIRLRDASDQVAWTEFVDLYRPAILGFARKRGLQSSDAEDLAQCVLMAVSQTVGQWNHDDRRARFRTWLHTVANRQVIDAFRRRARNDVSGGTSIQEFLARHPDPADDSRLLDEELRRQVFRRAAADARGEFKPDAWEAFRLTAIDGIAAADVASKLGKTTGAVYAARARVMRRIAERVRELAEFTGEFPAIAETFEKS